MEIRARPPEDREREGESEQEEARRSPEFMDERRAAHVFHRMLSRATELQVDTVRQQTDAEKRWPEGE
jgi:hypothetical protein